MMHTVIDSPIGELLLIGDGSNLTGLYTAEHVRKPNRNDTADAADGSAIQLGIFRQAREELAQYFAGERNTFDVPLAPTGTDFQRRVWNCLREIPYGETATYRQIAEEVGAPRAVRAVGAANGRNPISIIVPCHRVVGSDGSLTGYAGGLAAKQWLLSFEGARRPERDAAALVDPGQVTARA